jgi:hypothetical protein
MNGSSTSKTMLAHYKFDEGHGNLAYNSINNGIGASVRLHQQVGPTLQNLTNLSCLTE